MLKLLIKLAVVLVILLVVALVGLAFYIDSAARRAVEVAATRSLGVQTTLGDIDVGVASSSVSLENLQVANPQGYSTPYFLKLDQGKVAVSLGSLMKDKVIVPELTLDGAQMYLEKKDGKANYDVIMTNLGLDKPVPPEEQKKFIINNLTLRNITVHASLLPVGGSLTTTKVVIPEIQLKDVGSESEGGVLLGELSEVVVQAILQAVIEKSGELPATLIGELGAGLGQLDDLQAKGMKVIGGAGDEIQKGIGEASKNINKAAEGLGNLLGGKKKKDAADEKQGDAPKSK